MKLLVGLGMAVALIGAGCASGVSTLSFPNPPANTVAAPPPAPTLPGHLSSVSQQPVPGATTTTLPAIGPGSAGLTGNVVGPSGPVAGAVVEVDRLVGDAVGTAKVTTGADGRWNLPHIQGGRFRIRAWQSPSMDMTVPQVVFISGTQTLSLSLQLTQYQGPNVSFAIAPGAPEQGQPANLALQVTSPTVGPDGVLRNPPVVGAPVTLVDGPNWQVFNGNPRRTDINGNVLFQVSCTAPGPDPLSAQVQNLPPVTLQVPSCAPAPIPTVPTVPVPTFPAPTSTTCPPVPTTVFKPNSTTTSLAFGSC